MLLWRLKDLFLEGNKNMATVDHKAVYQYWRGEVDRVYALGLSTLGRSNYPWYSFAVDPGEVACWVCGAYSNDVDTLLSDKERRLCHWWKAWMRTRSGLIKSQMIFKSEKRPENYVFCCPICYCLAPECESRQEYLDWAIKQSYRNYTPEYLREKGLFD